MGVTYNIKEYPQDRYYFDMYDNTNRDKNWMTILKEHMIGPKGGAIAGIVNLSYFSLTDGSLQSAVKLHGEWLKDYQYTGLAGIGIDTDGRMKPVYPVDDVYSFTDGCPPMYMYGNTTDNYGQYASNGYTGIAIKSDLSSVCIIQADKDQGITSEEANQIFLDKGYNSIFRMDGSYSSHGRLEMGEVCSPSQYRVDRLYLLIYDREASAVRDEYFRVTLDPYGNFSPTSHPKTWEMINILQSRFIEQNIDCMISTFPDNYNLDSRIRAKQSNTWLANICLSIDADQIDSKTSITASNNINGISVVTSSAGSTAGRNILANAFIDAFKNGNYSANDLSHDSAIMMLSYTTAVANFIRFNQSNMTTEVMHDLSNIIVETVCNYLGIDYICPPNDGDIEDEDTPSTTPSGMTLTDEDKKYIQEMIDNSIAAAKDELIGMLETRIADMNVSANGIAVSSIASTLRAVSSRLSAMSNDITQNGYISYY